jgi:hypothetical protein
MNVLGRSGGVSSIFAGNDSTCAYEREAENVGMRCWRLERHEQQQRQIGDKFAGDGIK